MTACRLMNGVKCCLTVPRFGMAMRVRSVASNDVIAGAISATIDDFLIVLNPWLSLN
jgi:hypothetical protein